MQALISINDVDERFIMRAAKFWWAHRIAFEYGYDFRDVKRWDTEDVFEALAAIGLAKKNQPNPK